MLIYSAKEAQIALLVIKEMQILSKYLDFLDIFLEKKALILTKEINLTNSFIWSLKLFAVAFIFFVEKLDGSLHLCINYQGLNNLTIKNQYLLPLISELLDWLGYAKRFTQLDFTSAYYQISIKKNNK